MSDMLAKITSAVVVTASNARLQWVPGVANLDFGGQFEECKI